MARGLKQENMTQDIAAAHAVRRQGEKAELMMRREFANIVARSFVSISIVRQDIVLIIVPI